MCPLPMSVLTTQTALTDRQNIMCRSLSPSQNFETTRMHSSRMRTARNSSCHRGGSGVGVSTPRRSRHPLKQAPIGSRDPPLEQLPPWLWDWRPPGCGSGDTPGQIPLNFPLGCGPGDPLVRSSSTSPLVVGLETCKVCWDTTPWRPAVRHSGLPPAMHVG